MMRQGQRALIFYFDYVSHNAYLAWTQLAGLADRHGLDVEPVPVLFAGLLRACGQLGPAEIPAKSAWMIRDVLRKAALLRVPIAPPASHPFNPLPALRVSGLPLGAGDRMRLVDTLFLAAWARSLDISSPEVLRQVLNEAGFEGPRLVEEAATPASRQRIRDQTEIAIGKGVFGVPTMIVDGQLFWGLDDWPHLERFLRGEDPLRDDDLEPWLAVRPSTQRKR